MPRLPHPPDAKRSAFKKFAALALLPLALLFSSCEESKLFVLLNSDGSGRINITEKVLTSHQGIQNQQVLQAIAISTLGKFVEESEGVDAWEQLSFNFTPQGDIVVSATALFPDLAKLDLATTAENQTLLKGLKFDPGDAAEKRPASIELLSPVKLVPQQKLPGGEPPAESVIAEELSKTRDVWAEQEVNFRSEYGRKKSRVTFHLPGEISGSSNFIKEAKNQVYLEVRAQKMIDSLDRMIGDDEVAKAILETGGKIMDNDGAPPVKPNTFNELSFGEDKPIRVEFSGRTKFFDYDSAVIAARENPGELMQIIQEQIERTKNN